MPGGRHWGAPSSATATPSAATPPAASVARLKGDLLSRGLLPFTADNRIHVVQPAVVTPEQVARGLSILDDALTAFSG